MWYFPLHHWQEQFLILNQMVSMKRFPHCFVVFLWLMWLKPPSSRHFSHHFFKAPQLQPFPWLRWQRPLTTAVAASHTAVFGHSVSPLYLWTASCLSSWCMCIYLLFGPKYRQSNWQFPPPPPLTYLPLVLITSPSSCLSLLTPFPNSYPYSCILITTPPNLHPTFSSPPSPSTTPSHFLLPSTYLSSTSPPSTHHLLLPLLLLGYCV